MFQLFSSLHSTAELKHVQDIYRNSSGRCGYYAVSVAPVGRSLSPHDCRLSSCHAWLLSSHKHGVSSIYVDICDGACRAWCARTLLNSAVSSMDPNFVEIQTKFSADLHPSTLRNVTGSFQSILDDLLLTYRQRLGGIVLGYHDERIINKTASVHAFFPYFHVDAEATLSVLRLEQDKHLGAFHNSFMPFPQ